MSEALTLLEEQRRLLSFWTVTLPTSVLRRMAELDCWPAFVEFLLRRLRRALRRALGRAVVVGVVELQPGRTRDNGMPCPHLHLVFVGRASAGHGWAVTPESLDEMILKSVQECSIETSEDFRSAGNVQQVKKSVRAYLGKYLTKGSSDAEVWKGGPWESLIPRQWWLWTEECRLMVNRCRVQLPTGFLAWIWRNRCRLLEEGHFYLQQCRVPVDAPATYRIFWNKVENLALVYGKWQEALDDELWRARSELGIFIRFGATSFGHAPLTLRTRALEAAAP